MNNISEIKDACVGCFACKNICPKNAIDQKSDIEGFLYPIVDNTKCVGCCACQNVCPAISTHNSDKERLECYFGASEDKSIVRSSSSGGAFSVLSQKILEDGGIVYGAIFDEKSKSIIYSNSDNSTMDAIRKSKYVASETHEIFSDVKKELKSGRRVLFCGLPCHVDGLRLFLNASNTRGYLITVDFICGGTASPKFFRDYLDGMESKYKSKVLNVDFRAKLYGWKEHSIAISFDNGKIYRNYAMCDPFFKGYFEKTYQRDSCYHCQYRLKHYSDITIADYWGGLQKNIQNDDGLSMIIVNSEIGKKYMEKINSLANHTFQKMPIENSDYAFKAEKERYDKAIIKKSEFMKIEKKDGFIMATKKMYLSHPKLSKLRKDISRIKAKIKG